jgi:alginate O-acetyltransferase complex protein AlgI
MLFNSFLFVWLVLITFVLYYTPRLSKYQINLLIVSSLFFYAYNKPILLVLLLVSVGINVLTSYYVVYGDPQRQKLNAVIGVASNLFILAFFKYSPLFSKTFLETGSSVSEFLINIPLPIGISFFTFQGISLMVDVFNQKHFRSKDIISISLLTHAQKTLFFIAFFPQLIAGPIVKAHDFLPQINVKLLRDINWEIAFKNLVLGYFFKMVVADNLKDFTFWIAYPYFQGQSTINLISMLFGYSCQIFADFAGYSLIAIGLAQLFGYNLDVNFNFPYISSSFKEFWKRWHISLSSFLMEYLYFPMGGNRKGKYRTYINLMITMLLGGLWHGAAWSYAVWGGFHGFALAIERFLTDKITIQPNALIIFFKRIMVFIFVTFAWLFFKLPEFSHVIEYVKTIYRNTSVSNNWTLCLNIFLYSFPIFMYHALSLIKEKPYFVFIKKYEYMIYGFLLFLILTNSGSSGSFIYFQF